MPRIEVTAKLSCDILLPLMTINIVNNAVIRIHKVENTFETNEGEQWKYETCALNSSVEHPFIDL